MSFWRRTGGKIIIRVLGGLKNADSLRHSSPANLTLPGVRAMHVWTAGWVKHHATGNEIPPAEYTGYAGLPIRRLAGVLAGLLVPTPDLLPGPASSDRTLSRVTASRLRQSLPPLATCRGHRHSIASPIFPKEIACVSDAAE